jgi:hypothetical protein
VSAASEMNFLARTHESYVDVDPGSWNSVMDLACMAFLVFYNGQ